MTTFFRKQRSLILTLCLLLSLFPALCENVYATKAAYPLPSTNSNQAQYVVDIAESQNGYYDGGNDDNIYACELDVANYNQWCATFASWCVLKAGLCDYAPKDAWSSSTSLLVWFRS